ncbi:hypothetical protein SE91_16560 [Bradyrhizobium sp. DOA1]|nr:hypothetical protein SE91_16560 [Bradyrhizobium sp. DOA1]
MMYAFRCAHDVALLHERFEVLTSQLAELEELRMRVRIAEQFMKSTRADGMAKRLRTADREWHGAATGAILRYN